MDQKIYEVLETHLGSRGWEYVPGGKLILLYVPWLSTKQNYHYLENQAGEEKPNMFHFTIQDKPFLKGNV